MDRHHGMYAQGSDEELLASNPPPMNMNIQNVSWVIPESSRNGYNEEDFSSLYPPQPGSDLTYDHYSWWNNLWKVLLSFAFYGSPELCLRPGSLYNFQSTYIPEYI